MSDQNDRSKPDETPDQASGQESSQPERGLDAPAHDPFATSGQGSAAQGVTDPAGDPSGRAASSGPSDPGQTDRGQQNPYTTPGQSGSHAAYGSQGPSASQAGQYGAGQYGAGQAGQYGAGQAGQYSSQSPYGAPGQYGSQQAGPYGSQNPYGSQKTSDQQQYGQQQYGSQHGTAAGHNPYAASSQNPYGQPRKTSVLAILSIVFAFGGLLFGPLTVLTSPAGAIMGHIALGRIKQTGEQGRGLALAGIIGGWILTALAVLGIVAFILLAVFASENPDYGGYDGYDGYDTSSTTALIA